MFQLDLQINAFKVFQDLSQEKPGCFDDEKIELYSGSDNNPRETLIETFCGTGGKFQNFIIESKYGKNSYALVVFKSGNRPRNPPISQNFDQWNGFWFSWNTNNY